MSAAAAAPLFLVKKWAAAIKEKFLASAFPLFLVVGCHQHKRLVGRLGHRHQPAGSFGGNLFHCPGEGVLVVAAAAAAASVSVNVGVFFDLTAKQFFLTAVTFEEDVYQRLKCVGALRAGNR